MPRFIIFLLSITFIQSVLGPAAQAQTDEELARRHYETGASYYERGEYEDSLREFQRSHALSGEPALYYNISLAAQQLGRAAEAAEALGNYLTQVEVVENRANLEVRLENLRSRAAEAETPDPGPVPDPDPVPDPVIDPIRQTEPTSSGANVGSIVAFSVAGLSLISGVTFGVFTLAEDGNLGDGCGATQTCTDDDLSSLQTFGLIADISFGVSLVAAGVGLVLLLTGDSGSSSSDVAVLPAVGPDGGGIALHGGF